MVYFYQLKRLAVFTMKLAYSKLCYKNLIMHSIPYKFQLSTLDLNLWRKEVVLHKRGL